MLTKHINRSVFLWTGSVLLLLTATLLSLPLVIHSAIENTLSRMGAEKITLEDVDFNPFLGRALIKGLTAQAGDLPPLKIDNASMEVSVWSLWRKRLLVEILTAQGLDIEVIQSGQNPLVISGMTVPVESKGDEQAWDVGIRKLIVEHSDINVTSDYLKLAVHAESFELNDFFSYTEAIPMTASMVGSLNGAPIKYSLKATIFSQPRYVNGSVQLQSLDIGVLSALLPDSIVMQKGSLSLDMTINALQERNEYYRIGINGSTNMEELAFRLPEEGLAFRHKNLDWKGNLELTHQLNALSWILRGDVTSDQSIIQQELNNKQSPMLTANKSRFLGLEIGNTVDMSINDIELTTIEVNLKRIKNGNLQFPTRKAMAAEATVKESQKGDEVKPGHYRVNRLKIRDRSTVSFEDESVTPIFQQKLLFNEFMLDKLDSANPSQPLSIRMNGKVGEYSKVSLSGDIYPFHEKLSMDLIGNIESLDLHPFTSYTLPTIGYDLESGHLNGDIKIKITQGIIDSEADLKIKNLTIKPSDPQKTEKFEERLDMPLNAAISLLRDDKGVIKLNLPIKGDLDNPKFNLADAISQSMNKAMKFTVITYLKLALQPYGSLVAIAQVVDTAGKKITAIKLDPIMFNLGKSLLDEKNKNYLNSAVKLLNKHKNIELKICGKSTLGDLSKLTKKQGRILEIDISEDEEIPDKKSVLSAVQEKMLLELARKRSLKVKNYLVDDGEIKADRLFICNPEIDKGEKGNPRVELII